MILPFAEENISVSLSIRTDSDLVNPSRLRVGAVRHEEQHALFPVIGEPEYIGNIAVNRRKIYFKITGMNDGPDVGLDRKTDTADYRMVHLDEFDGKTCRSVSGPAA